MMCRYFLPEQKKITPPHPYSINLLYEYCVPYRHQQKTGPGFILLSPPFKQVANVCTQINDALYLRVSHAECMLSQIKQNLLWKG